MRPIPLAMIALLVTAGCLGLGGDDASEEPLRKARAEVSEDTGGIEGVVTDPAVQPIEGAQVTLEELGETVESESDGSFAFSTVPPATYTLTVNASGFVATEKTLSVQANDVTRLDVILAHTVSEDAYTQTWELTGFFECGVAAGLNLSAAGEGTIARSFRLCGSVASLSENATNDRSDHTWSADAPIETFVFETQWDAGNTGFADSLWVDVIIDPIHCGNYCNWTVLDMNGPSPLQSRIDRGRFENISAYFEEACEEGEDQFCGYNFWDNGWPLWSRVYPRWECQPTPAQACAPIQQEYKHFVTAFYNAPAPDGYSLLD